MSARRWLPAAVCAGVALNTARLRRRLAALPVAQPSDDRVHHTHVFLLADGVRLDDAQQRAASAHARRHGLDVLDLVPAELTADRLLDLARMVDTTTYQADRLAWGRGAFQALLIDRDVLTRAGLHPKDVNEVDLVAITETLKRYAPVTTGLAVLPGLRAAPRTGATRLAVQRAAYRWNPLGPLGPTLRDALLLAGSSAAPRWALAATALSAAQPAVVGAGRVRLAPADLVRAPLTRRRGAAELLADLTGRARSAPKDPAGTGGRLARWWVAPPRAFTPDDAEHAAEIRAGYRADLAGGVERFLEAERSSCPWCGGTRLRKVITGFDATQAKPGRFRYDRCADCRHVFQNPRLTLEGLDFYYRDFYDGLGGELAELIAGAGAGPYLARARAVPPTPNRWLDVGAGLGHFCLIARDTWPTTTFDGLDLGDGIHEAARRGWINTAHHGQFPDLAETFAGHYDVISMFHYLEHTRDPRTELDAAKTALTPGGHLLIEVPNPDSPAMRIYGPLSPGWMVPQHQHLLPADNLVAALTERGFTIENLEFGDTHMGGDGMYAWWALAQRLAPSPGLPWRDDPYPSLARAKRAATLAALGPLFPLLVAAEAASKPYLTRGTRANAYRILARVP
ncbi:class I SAM-dependent methyltransferase [Frankia nepalensis]|uniref:Class I SAM-dependent methyltransferase n=1 Tax=Frankia nepalensis TaxID=1836974 RepID=A0A937UMB7_9ACTN|nr:class I SAM-dependent methyltransferase [Frankia nepalensis]MBL7497216.1 class I SAM-dependent methyltransferase [Frankia nepalensis]MBL7510349.1 class I SAM-dependent methyltransferase [Frankia nepalensis]MBL7626687.1 class I SAM-dependent methyltransferase [Frankia nepalensis]